MKKIYTILAPLCMAVLSFTSCISDEEVVTSPECAIISFSVSDIKSEVVVKNAAGNDTTITKTISGSEVKFNIDQLNGRIFAIDSLPSWTDLSHVVPSFSAYGYVYGQTNLQNNDTLFYYITSSSDSLDLRKPMELYVVSTDGMSSKKYTLEMYKKESSSDTLEWRQSVVTEEFAKLNRFVTINNNVYAFYEKNGETLVSKSVNGIDWTTNKTDVIKPETVLSAKNKMFALGNDSYLYVSEDGMTWTKTSSISVERLLAADSYYIYAFDGNNIIGASLDNMDSWEPCGNSDIENIPTSFVSSYAFTSKTNRSLEMVTMIGLSENNHNNGVAWFKISSSEKLNNQDWSYTNISSQNLYKFPYLANMSATKYDGAIFVIGKENGAYNNIYRSDDYGISWHVLDGKYPLPEDINDSNDANASILTVGEELWIVKGNKIWKGIIQ